ncbi:MAG: hypothetical protein L6R42_010991, partial [Xanthoria sp. 1 TBL-2021]
LAEDLPFGKGSIGNAGPFDLEVEELDIELDDVFDEDGFVDEVLVTDDFDVVDLEVELAEDLPFGKGSIGNTGPFDLEVVEVPVVDTLELDDPVGLLDVPSY